MRIVTTYSRDLFNELKKRGVQCELEGWLKKKHVDILIHDPKICIEIDGPLHYIDPKQIVTDFHRDDYSTEDGYHTLRIPNETIKMHLHEVADAIERIVEVNKMS